MSCYFEGDAKILSEEVYHLSISFQNTIFVKFLFLNGGGRGVVFIRLQTFGAFSFSEQN